MRLARLLCLGLLLLASPACLYTKVVVPLDQDVHATVLGDKVGRASAHSVMWLVAWGDRGTQAAVANGNITKVHHMDLEFMAYLFGLYSRQTTIVYGE